MRTERAQEVTALRHPFFHLYRPIIAVKSFHYEQIKEENKIIIVLKIIVFMSDVISARKSMDRLKTYLERKKYEAQIDHKPMEERLYFAGLVSSLETILKIFDDKVKLKPDQLSKEQDPQMDLFKI